VAGNDRGVHPLQRRNAFLPGGVCPRRECRFGGCNGTLRINLIRQTHLANHLCRRRIVQIKTFSAVWGDKFTVDKDLFDVTHKASSGCVNTVWHAFYVSIIHAMLQGLFR
jgi:hypothetical protein